MLIANSNKSKGKKIVHEIHVLWNTAKAEPTKNFNMHINKPEKSENK